MIYNLLFDLGGVLVDLDIHRTLREMQALMSVPNAEVSERDLLGAGGSQLVDAYQVGAVSSEQFFGTIAGQCRPGTTPAQVEQAWMDMLVGIPQQRLKAILDAKQRGLHCHVLSNINESHVQWTLAHLQAGFRALDSSVDEVFTHCYFSNEIHLAKPSPECYDFVLKDSGINPAETLYIDDLEQNIQAGQHAGLRTLQALGDAWIPALSTIN